MLINIIQSIMVLTQITHTYILWGIPLEVPKVLPLKIGVCGSPPGVNDG